MKLSTSVTIEMMDGRGLPGHRISTDRHTLARTYEFSTASDLQALSRGSRRRASAPRSAFVRSWITSLSEASSTQSHSQSRASLSSFVEQAEKGVQAPFATLRVKYVTLDTDYVYLGPVTLEEDAIRSLRASGLLDVLTWAAPVAFAATDQLYDEDQGHGQGFVGYTNFTHYKDLVDRATANGRFTLGDGLDGFGGDVLKRGITREAFDLMPSLPPGAVVRRDYKQSPGWAIEGYRVLLQSYPFGKVDDIKWVQRSEAKRRVADQLFVGDETLFSDEEFGLESTPGIPEDEDFAGVTLIAAHAFNPSTKQFELYIGQSKNPEYADDACWHWKLLLLSGGTPAGGTGIPVRPSMPRGGASTEVEDVPVRVKRAGAREGADAANG